MQCRAGGASDLPPLPIIEAPRLRASARTWHAGVAPLDPLHKLVQPDLGVRHPRVVEAEGRGGVWIQLHTAEHLAGRQAGSRVAQSDLADERGVGGAGQ